MGVNRIYEFFLSFVKCLDYFGSILISFDFNASECAKGVVNQKQVDKYICKLFYGF